MECAGAAGRASGAGAAARGFSRPPGIGRGLRSGADIRAPPASRRLAPASASSASLPAVPARSWTQPGSSRTVGVATAQHQDKSATSKARTQVPSTACARAVGRTADS